MKPITEKQFLHRYAEIIVNLYIGSLTIERLTQGVSTAQWYGKENIIKNSNPATTQTASKTILQAIKDAKQKEQYNGTHKL